MVITLPEDFTQDLFNIALEAVKKGIHYAGIYEPRIEVEESYLGSKTINLVECYMDMDEEHPGQSIPHIWYNKSELDKRNIKYGK